MKLCIIGIGLIGGSMARAIRTIRPDFKIYGIDNNEKHLTLAKLLNIIDRQADWEILSEMDFIILSVPVNTAVNILPDILDKIKKDALVWDVGSTKGAICEKVAKHKNRHQFLATHPIAGTEYSGPEKSLEKLFQGKIQIICEPEKTASHLLKKGEQIFIDLKMHLRYMSPISHDKHVAYVSHLSHISAFMLGKTVLEKEKDEKQILDLAGSGFEATVRLAKSNPDTWASIFIQNKKYILETLIKYIENLEKFKSLLAKNDEAGIYLQIKKINSIKNVLKGIKKNKI